MRVRSHYNTVYVVTFLVSSAMAIVALLTMSGHIGVSKILWLLVLSLEAVALVVCVVNYDPRFPSKSPNHNVYRIYIISLLAMVLVVWLFFVLAMYGAIIAEVAIMTYLFFCLPIWLTLSVSFYELQKTYTTK
jgi:heme/copper-type cytochrome/quinol oxidase subunit 4